MAIENVQQLLSEQLGKNRCDVITTTAMSGKDYYAVYFPVTSVVSNLEAANATTAAGSAIANLETTLPAGTSILLNVTAITLSSGIALCYYEQVI
tara:strand:+ start:1064 stop:1348 length:285 start_codon:yes stop_codon:yes gene_type:complete